ncbi:RIP metalloprotease RseP [Roseomonas sp. OT10]|uniref:RIP metalloprotease RseP n=1 Tax=Roseomonas cutis TaxID=2897332 RepID=UPI001E458362|nr:RIP metalloprotease RseP [Roseomonas sp. OT10]UFN51406.1 RIP metalloprotease RseP [Roseomonas sp. OT10]
MFGSVRTVVAFLVVLGVLVFIHELGHYLAARWRGVHVERFSIGFGRALARWTDRRGTQWRVGWLPLGGYVKLHGQEQPGDVDPAIRATWRPGETFHDKPVLDRAIVVAAGPIANFALAAVLFAALFATVGRPVQTATVGAVVAGSAAERAGVQPGDAILSIDGQPIRRFQDVQSRVEPSAGRPLQLLLSREGRELTVTATPEARVRSEGTPPVGVLGVAAGAPVFERVNPLSAVWQGIAYTGDVSKQTLVGVWEMITRARGTEELGGPLRIAQISGQAAALGLASLVTFIAVLSVNLALINLFPIPVLDGGHLVFYAAEAIRGRPLPPRAQEYGLRAGLAVLAMLFIFSTWNDLSSFGLFRWLGGLAG